jgi:hypothetical protein
MPRQGTSGEVRAGRIDRLDRKRYQRGNMEDELHSLQRLD